MIGLFCILPAVTAKAGVAIVLYPLNGMFPIVPNVAIEGGDGGALLTGLLADPIGALSKLAAKLHPSHEPLDNSLESKPDQLETQFDPVVVPG